jgi:hypothetical protein
VSLGLLVADRGDGTGGDAQISGAGSSAVTLYRGAFSGGLGIVQWLPAGTRTGDGAIPVDLAVAGAAYFFWYAAAAGALSPVVYQSLTDGAASVDDRIVDAVVALAQTLMLPGIAEITRDDVPTMENRYQPCIQVTGYQQIEQDAGGSCGADDVTYPVALWLLSYDRKGVADDRQARLWRHRIGTAFRAQRLAGVSEVMTCAVDSNVSELILGDDNKLYRRSLTTLRFKARIRRGLGV